MTRTANPLRVTTQQYRGWRFWQAAPSSHRRGWRRHLVAMPATTVCDGRSGTRPQPRRGRPGL